MYIALARPKCKNCCVDGASPDAKYIACGMQRVAKMLMSYGRTRSQSVTI